MQILNSQKDLQNIVNHCWIGLLNKNKQDLAIDKNVIVTPKEILQLQLPLFLQSLLFLQLPLLLQSADLYKTKGPLCNIIKEV